MKEYLKEYFQLDRKPNLAIGVNFNTKKLRDVSEWIKKEYSTTLIPADKNISILLLGKSATLFSKEIIEWFSEKLKKNNTSPILLIDIEILFEPSLELDPLTIFKQASRNTSLLVLWPGEYKNNILSYASPEHAHYRTWARPGVEIIQI